jgi:hypothetical protein
VTTAWAPAPGCNAFRPGPKKKSRVDRTSIRDKSASHTSETSSIKYVLVFLGGSLDVVQPAFLKDKYYIHTPEDLDAGFSAELQRWQGKTPRLDSAAVYARVPSPI